MIHAYRSIIEYNQPKQIKESINRSTHKISAISNIAIPPLPFGVGVGSQRSTCWALEYYL